MHGGNSNAFTCEEHTNYFFDVAPEHLEGALDRFAQFFIKPLFNESGAQREMQAVDSEHQKNVNDDNWRMNQLDKHLSSPKHPFSRFYTGTLETLKKEGIREALIEFHDSYYSANLMKLVVFGRDSLDTLQKWVVTMFSPVVNAQVALPQFDTLPWDLDNYAPSLVKVRTLKEMLSLNITWLISDQRAHYKTKPEVYLTHLIGHEGEGSLYQALKKRGWASALSASTDDDSRGYSFAQLSIDLSPLGLIQYKEVAKMVFEYIALLRKWGPKAHIWEDIRLLSDIGYRYQEKGDPSNYTYSKAMQMQKYQNDPRLILAGPYILETYDEACIKALIDELGLNNFRLTLSSKEPFNADELVSVQKEPWYGTEYITEQISAQDMIQYQRAFTGEERSDDLYLPKANPFIPHRFDTYPISDEPIHTPKKLKATPMLNVWYKADDTFEQPKSSIFLFFRTDMIRSSVSEAERAELFHDLMMHCMLLYDAILARLRYEINVTDEGVELFVFGFSDKLPNLMQAILEFAAKPSFTDVDFGVVKDKRIRRLQNFPQEKPSWHAPYGIRSVVSKSFFGFSERLEAIQKLELSDIISGLGFWQDLLNSSRMDMLVHGSMPEESVLQLADTVLSLAKKTDHMIEHAPKSQAYPQAFDYSCVAGGGIALVPEPLDNPNSAIEISFPTTLTNSPVQRTLNALLISILQEPFFNILRTQEQLGYIVFHGLRTQGNLNCLRFIIQSAKDPLFLDARIESFLKDFVPEYLDNLTEEEFEKYRKALIHDLTKKKKHLMSESRDIWSYIRDGLFEFEAASVDAKLLATDKTGKDAVKAFFGLFIHPDSPKRIKLAAHVWSNQASAAPLSEYSNIKNLRVFTSRQALLEEIRPAAFPSAFDLQE